MSCIRGCFSSKPSPGLENKENSIVFSSVSKVGLVAHGALKSLDRFWFVPFGAILFIMAGRHWMPLNGLVFGGTTLASLIAFSTLPQKNTSSEKKTGGLMLNATVIIAAATLFGIACNLLRGMPKVFNYVAPLGVGLTGLLTGRALVRLAVQSVKESALPLAQKPSASKKEEVDENGGQGSDPRKAITESPHGAPSRVQGGDDNIIIIGGNGSNNAQPPNAQSLSDDMENNNEECYRPGQNNQGSEI